MTKKLQEPFELTYDAVDVAHWTVKLIYEMETNEVFSFDYVSHKIKELTLNSLEVKYEPKTKRCIQSTRR